MMPGYEHLREDLHVLIEYEGSCEARNSCLQCAEKMVNELLQPPVSDDQDELKKTQLKELAILNGTYQVLIHLSHMHIGTASCHLCISEHASGMSTL